LAREVLRCSPLMGVGVLSCGEEEGGSVPSSTKAVVTHTDGSGHGLPRAA